mgnify:CR=1 FL=1
MNHFKVTYQGIDEDGLATKIAFIEANDKDHAKALCNLQNICLQIYFIEEIKNN